MQDMRDRQYQLITELQTLRDILISVEQGGYDSLCDAIRSEIKLRHNRIIDNHKREIEFNERIAKGELE